MYEHDQPRLDALRTSAPTDPAVLTWTNTIRNEIAIQAVAIMQNAGITLPPGEIDDFVELRIPKKRQFGVETCFVPWNNQEVHLRNNLGAPPNLGYIEFGDEMDATVLANRCPTLTSQQIRAFQLRAMTHELMHTLDYDDTLCANGRDYDLATTLSEQHFGRANASGYARNEIDVDSRTQVVFERNNFPMFPELLAAFEATESYTRR